MRAGTVLLLLAFFAGGAIGYVVGDQGGGEAHPSGPEAGPQAPSAEPPAPPTPSVDSSGGADLAALVRSAPAAAPVGGTGRIDGKVVDEAGNPLAGITVRATARGSNQSVRGRPSPEDGSAPEKTSLEEDVRWFLQAEVERRTRRRETVSRADGTFEFTGVPAVEHSIHAYRRGMRFQRNGGFYWTPPGHSVTLVGHLEGLVTVEVLGPDGEPADRAVIGTRQTGNQWRTRNWIAERPAFTLKLGEWKIRAEGGPRNEFVSEESTVRLTRDEPQVKLTLRLAQRPGIRGMVVFPPDEPGAYAEVRADPDPMVDRDEEWSTRRQRTARVQAGTGGRFFLKDLEPGSYEVYLVNYPKEGISKRVTFTDGPADVELAVPAPTPDSSVLVRATGPDGGDVPDLSISGSISTGKGGWDGGGRAVRLADGVTWRYYFKKTVSEARKEGGGKVTRSISASSSLYGSTSVDVPEGTKQVDLKFAAPARLVVTIDNWGDTGRESRVKLAFIAGTDHHFSGWGGAQIKGGEHTAGPLRPDDYTIYLTYPVDDHENMVIAKSVVSLVSGENPVILSIPKFYRLTAAVEGGEDIHFRLTGPGFSTHPQMSKDGEISWEVPAGEYTVDPWGGNDLGPERKVHVPAETRVVFTKFVPDCMQVRISGPGALRDAGFIDGDYVIGVNGTAFTDRRQMKALLTLAVRAPSATFTILRAGKSQEVKVSGALLTREGTSLGGTFDRAMRPR